MSTLIGALFNQGPTQMQVACGTGQQTYGQFFAATTAMCLIQHDLGQVGVDLGPLASEMDGLVPAVIADHPNLAVIGDSMSRAAAELARIAVGDPARYGAVIGSARARLDPFLRYAEGVGDSSGLETAARDIQGVLEAGSASARLFVGNAAFQSALAGGAEVIARLFGLSDADVSEAGDPQLLPAGRVFAIDVILRQKAEMERIETALRKLKDKDLVDVAELEGIRAAFMQALYMQNLPPSKWYEEARAIVAGILGKRYDRDVATKINQVLFVCSRFHFAETPRPEILSRYSVGESIPDSIIDAPTSTDGHTMRDVPGYLENRLGRTIMGLLTSGQCDIDIFIGPKEDMITYYRTTEPPLALKGEIESPTSTEFYLMRNGSARPTIVVTGITNESRFRHQLWQFKYAGVDIRRVKVRGTFKEAFAPHADALRRELARLPVHPRVVVFGQR